MTINLDQAFQTFLDEANELLQVMEESLLRLESSPDDKDIIGSIFRAAHTIKGSAGLFGLDPIVSFTHVLEDLLDCVRNDEVQVDSDLIALLLESGDHLQDLLRIVAVESGQPDEATVAREQQLRERLAGYREPLHITEEADELLASPISPANTTENVVEKIGDDLTVTSDLWHISLRFGPNVYKNGMDPASFLRYLGTLGKIVNITTIADSIPGVEEMDAETCYLGFELDVKSDADKATLAAVFDFVSDDCEIHILPPHSKASEYMDLISALPEGDARLGELLVNSGALTQQELENGLSQQKQQSDNSGQSKYLGEILVAQGSVEPTLVQAALKKQTQVSDKKSKERHFIRVEATKLDALINLVGELVIAGAGANLLAQVSKDSDLLESTSRVTELVEQIRDSALRMRMVPIGDTFNRFNRVVRDVSQELGKSIDLRISGGDTEVDKSVVEQIGDPLMHLLRNSMDHGIESPERRIALGKPATGVLNLNAYHDSGNIVIEIADDGSGLNRDRILQKALDNGLVQPGTPLSDNEIHQLIFEPGFSTAEVVTNLSGRGVGMDVVKRNITALRGSIELESKPGEGTCFRIRLPLTLAIIDGFLVSVDHTSYILPLDMVQECLELSGEERAEARARNYLNLRGEVLPLIFLRTHFDLPKSSARRENVVVVRYAGQKAGIVVDELLGEFQTVIKPLGKLFSGLRGISGSTILGNGDVALIVDVPSLVQLIVQQEARLNAHSGRSNYLAKGAIENPDSDNPDSDNADFSSKTNFSDIKGAANPRALPN